MGLPEDYGIDFTVPYDTYTSGDNWVLTDLDGDGDPDIVVTNVESGSAQVGDTRWKFFPNTGKGFSAGSRTGSCPRTSTPTSRCPRTATRAV